MEELKKDDEFKRKVLEEIKDKEILDIKALIREYISCFGKVHKKLREVLNNEIEESETFINKMLKRFKNEFGQGVKTDTLSVVIMEDRNVVDSVSIKLDNVIKRRKDLVVKNGALPNLNRRYSTGEIIKDS